MINLTSGMLSSHSTRMKFSVWMYACGSRILLRCLQITHCASRTTRLWSRSMRKHSMTNPYTSANTPMGYRLWSASVPRCIYKCCKPRLLRWYVSTLVRMCAVLSSPMVVTLSQLLTKITSTSSLSGMNLVSTTYRVTADTLLKLIIYNGATMTTWYTFQIHKGNWVTSPHTCPARKTVTKKA